MEPEVVTATFIAAVRRLMAAQSPPWTQRDLGKKLGVTEQNVSRMLSGRIFPGSDTLAQLCTVFGVEPKELLSPDEPKPAKKPKK